jgi:hypothetical protein
MVLSSFFAHARVSALASETDSQLPIFSWQELLCVVHPRNNHRVIGFDRVSSRDQISVPQDRNSKLVRALLETDFLLKKLQQTISAQTRSS